MKLNKLTAKEKAELHADFIGYMLVPAVIFLAIWLIHWFLSH